MMNIDDVAKALKELGHSKRLAIYRLLVKAGKEGIPVGSIQEALDIPGSTLSHHLKALEAVQLIAQRREGRTLFCVAQYAKLTAIIGFLEDECCITDSH